MEENRIRPFGGFRRAMGGLRREGSGVTSFVYEGSVSLASSFLSEISTPLSTGQRVIAAVNFLVVWFGNVRFVLVVSILDFLLLPPKAFLASITVTLVAFLWEDLQVALMLVLLVLGIWFTHRLWRLFLHQWADSFWFCVATLFKKDFLKDSYLLRRILVSCFNRVQHLPFAAQLRFIQVELVVLFRCSMWSSANPELARQALALCMRVLWTLEDNNSKQSIRERLLDVGALAEIAKRLDSVDLERQRLCIELVCFLTHGEISHPEYTEEHGELFGKLVSILAKHRSSAPQIATPACAAIANVCSSDGFINKDMQNKAAHVLREIARGPAALNVQVLAARTLLNLSSGRLIRERTPDWSGVARSNGGQTSPVIQVLAHTVSSQNSPQDEADRHQQFEEDGEQGESVRLFFQILASKPPTPLCHIACQFFRKLVRDVHGAAAKYAIKLGTVGVLSNVLRSAAEPAIIMESLSALTSFTVCGDSELLSKIEKHPHHLTTIVKLLMHQEGMIRRYALISLLYLNRRLHACTYDRSIPVHCQEERCSICWTEYDSNDVVIALPDCQHVFHLTCINTWLLGQHSAGGSSSTPDCPLCKKPLSLVPVA